MNKSEVLKWAVIFLNVKEDLEVTSIFCCDLVKVKQRYVKWVKDQGQKPRKKSVGKIWVSFTFPTGCDTSAACLGPDP